MREAVMSRLTRLGALAALVFVLAGCGNSNETSSDGTTTTSSSATTVALTTTAAGESPLGYSLVAKRGMRLDKKKLKRL
jgi:ABC-type glycerol-3-phosphate transport system substrate-binding protein